MNNQAPSPASSLASDTDAYNTADARIHFGPLRSPEKRFHSIVACSNLLHPSPSRSSPRRSPRISNLCPLSPHVTVGESSSTRYEHNHVNVNEGTERTEVVDPLHPETPEYEQFLQDGELHICSIQASSSRRRIFRTSLGASHQDYESTRQSLSST
jgi:hypothetical protein